MDIINNRLLVGEKIYFNQIKMLCNLLQFFANKNSRVVIVCIFEIFLQLIQIIFKKSLHLILILRAWQPGYFTNWKFVGWNKKGYNLITEQNKKKEKKERDESRKKLIEGAKKTKSWAFLPKEKAEWRVETVGRYRWKKNLNRFFIFDLLIVIQPALHGGILEESLKMGVPFISITSLKENSVLYTKSLSYNFYINNSNIFEVGLFLQILRVLLIRIDK